MKDVLPRQGASAGEGGQFREGLDESHERRAGSPERSLGRRIRDNLDFEPMETKIIINANLALLQKNN